MRHRLLAGLVALACAWVLLLLVVASPLPQAEAFEFGDETTLLSVESSAELESAELPELDADSTDREVVLAQVLALQPDLPPFSVPAVPEGRPQDRPAPPHRPPPALA